MSRQNDMPTWPWQTVKKLKLLAVAFDLEWGKEVDSENQGRIKVHDAMQRYSAHVSDRAFELPRPTLTQLLAADKAARKQVADKVSKGTPPDVAIRDSMSDHTTWYTKMVQGDYFKETGHEPKKRSLIDNAQSSPRSTNKKNERVQQLWQGSSQIQLEPKTANRRRQGQGQQQRQGQGKGRMGSSVHQPGYRKPNLLAIQ